MASLIRFPATASHNGAKFRIVTFFTARASTPLALVSSIPQLTV